MYVILRGLLILATLLSPFWCTTAVAVLLLGESWEYALAYGAAAWLAALGVVVFIAVARAVGEDFEWPWRW